jgi:hypothetical protein
MSRGAADETAPALPGEPLEKHARNALLSGAVLLVLGIAAVGVGYPTEGALPVVVGLALTVFAIHSYGRLGPEDLPSEEEDGATRALASTRIARGALAIAVAGAVTWGTYAAHDGGERLLLFAVAGAWGISQVIQGRKLNQEGRRPPPPRAAAPRAKAKVEKRRRLDKSPPP